MSTLVAVPSMNPGGLESEVMPHFGHCDVFTLVEMDNGSIINVRILQNQPHEHGDCVAPVRFLAEHGVSVMLAGGMGRRPFMAFQENGIQVYFSGTEGSVIAALQGYAQGKLPAFGDNGLCQGGCGGH
ncbi:NifB/NifX family molybdenum-iron cluster-binding protein [Desulfovibrio sp. OttesenSCG-928-M16]|nr:NifB/NifX family molybdenum-iron cluster-binding protein [Desulfovibrio sp. OttesenSCG-928-M16]